MLSKNLPVFCQTGDEAQIKELGFEEVTPIEEAITWSEITSSRTPDRLCISLDGETMIFLADAV